MSVWKVDLPFKSFKKTRTISSHVKRTFFGFRRRKFEDLSARSENETRKVGEPFMSFVECLASRNSNAGKTSDLSHRHFHSNFPLFLVMYRFRFMFKTESHPIIFRIRRERTSVDLILTHNSEYCFSALSTFRLAQNSSKKVLQCFIALTQFRQLQLKKSCWLTRWIVACCATCKSQTDQVGVLPLFQYWLTQLEKFYFCFIMDLCGV